MKTIIKSKAMTQEEKDLLLKDLCVRLPYDTIVYYKTDGWESQYDTLSPQIIDNMVHRFDIIVKPYLRPMSSMTEEEVAEYQKFLFPCPDYNGKVVIGVYHRDLDKVYDWLNANHFDYRGLIEKGLALKAHKDTYIRIRKDDYGTDR